MATIRKPELDLFYAPGTEHRTPNFLDKFFPVPANSGNARGEEEFLLIDYWILNAPITLGKGYDQKKSEEVSLVIYDETEDDNELTYIIRELGIIKRLDHVNVLKFYEAIGSKKNLTDLAYVLEPHYGLMSEMLEENVEFEPRVIKRIMQDLFTALRYLHENNIIHMNIQPENLLFSSTGVLKVWNFRNALLFNQRAKRFDCNEFRYQPLELLMETLKYDETVDIWGANCIFAQLWLKRALFPEYAREVVIQAIFKVLGFPRKEIWEEFHGFYGAKKLVQCFGQIAKYNRLDAYFKRDCDSDITKNAMDLIHKCFRFNPKYRPKAFHCLNHPYFFEKPIACVHDDIVTVVDNATIIQELQVVNETIAATVNDQVEEILTAAVNEQLQNVKVEELETINHQLQSLKQEEQETINYQLQNLKVEKQERD